MSLLDSKPIYKPFHYPWAYDAWLTQQRIHWLPEEVPLADDVKDWRNRLTDTERNPARDSDLAKTWLKPDNRTVALYTIDLEKLSAQAREARVALKAVQKASSGNTINDVRTIFDKAAQIDDIKSLRGQDLDVSKVNERVVVGFEYERNIPLVGPAYLVYRFSYQTN